MQTERVDEDDEHNNKGVKSVIKSVGLWARLVRFLGTIFCKVGSFGLGKYS